MASRPTIGVVTVTYNSASVLPEFLRCVWSQAYNDLILYAVDNASKDATLEILAECADPRLRVIANSDNRGVAAGNNQGIHAAVDAGCEYVLLLNNDVVFGPDLFQQLLDGLAANHCQMTAPLIYYHDRPDIIWAAGGHFQRWLGYRCIHYGINKRASDKYLRTREVTHAPTCCVLIERDVFDTIGLMDERYFVYGDDNDFMYRAMKAQLKLFRIPQASMWHKVSSLTGTKSPFSIRFVARNRAYFITKHASRTAATLYSFVYRTYYLFRYILRKDDIESLRIKQAAWSEGLHLAERSSHG